MSYINSHQLETWSFYWSEARLVVAALALLLGGVPPVYLVFGGVPALMGLVTLGLKISWIISGLAALYLLAHWLRHKQMVFGGKNNKDMIAFFVLIISGINLGLTGLLGQNIGMSIASGRLVFLVVAVLYLWTAYHLWARWKSHGQRVF